MAYDGMKITRCRKRVFEEQQEQIVLELFQHPPQTAAKDKAVQDIPPLPVLQSIAGLLESKD